MPPLCHRSTRSLGANFTFPGLSASRQPQSANTTHRPALNFNPPNKTTPPKRTLYYNPTLPSPLPATLASSNRRLSLDSADTTTTLPLAPKLLHSLRILPSVLDLDANLSLLNGPQTDVTARTEALEEVVAWLGLENEWGGQPASHVPARGPSSPTLIGDCGTAFGPGSRASRMGLTEVETSTSGGERDGNNELPADIERLSDPVKQWIAAIVLEAMLSGREVGRAETSVLGSPTLELGPELVTEWR